MYTAANCRVPTTDVVYAPLGPDQNLSKRMRNWCETKFKGPVRTIRSVKKTFFYRPARNESHFTVILGAERSTHVVVADSDSPKFPIQTRVLHPLPPS